MCSQHHLPWNHWELAQNADSWAPLAALSLPASRSCFLSQEILCCPSPPPKSFLSSGSLCYLMESCLLSLASCRPLPHHPSGPKAVPQDCGNGLFLCVHTTHLDAQRWALADGLRDPNLTRRRLLSEGWLKSPGDLCSFTLHSFFNSEGLLGLHQT